MPNNQNFNKNKKGNSNMPLGNENQGIYFLVFLLIVLGLFIFIAFFYKTYPVISYNEFVDKIKKGSIAEVMIQGQVIEGYFKAPINGVQAFKTVIPLQDKDLLSTLFTNNVVIKGEPEKDSGGGFIWWIMLISVGMFVLWFFLMRNGQGGDPGRAMAFGRSKARMHKEVGKIKFDNVAGCKEAKDDLQETVEFLKNPGKFTALGARIPQGVLLVGSPGTGKTLLAKAVAGEANVPFFSVSGSEFVEMFVGVGASRVRDLFGQARKNAPCIIFIDELDAVGRSRGTGLGGSHDEREQTLNQILVEMDGFDSSEGVIIIAATNRPDILDPALMRPGRFDRQIVVDKPDIQAREEILKVHTRKIPLAKGIDLNTIARGTPGLTGADIENLVNEAALKAARENRKSVHQEDFDFAKDKVMMGPERRSRVLLEEDKLITAYHESGHAILGHYLPLTDPIHKVTIIPRGFANGLTQYLPDDERTHTYKEELQEYLMVLLGGRAAEEFKFGKEWISGGAAHDIEQATKLATSMVCDWGMSEVLGPVKYGEKEGPVFLGKDLVTHKNYSEKMHETIDMEVKALLGGAYKRALETLKKYQSKLEDLSQKLLEKEVLVKEDIESILGESEKNRFPVMKKLGLTVKSTEATPEKA